MRGLREAVDECIFELRQSGHDVDVDVIGELIKTSRSPRYSKFARIKNKTLKTEIQTILSAGTMNETIRKLYLNNSKIADSKNADLAPPVSLDSRTPDEESTESVRRKRPRRKADDSTRSDPGPENKIKKSRRHFSEETSDPTISNREFLPEVLPNFKLDALGGIDKSDLLI